MNTVNVPPHCGFLIFVYHRTNHLIFGFVSENVDGKKGKKKQDEAEAEEEEDDDIEEGGSEEEGSEDGMDEDL